MRALTDPARRFACVRVALGLLLAFEFGTLAAHARDLFGPAGLARAAGISPYISAVAGEPAVLGAMAVVALGFAAGVLRRSSAIALWAAWAMVVNGAPWVTVPSDGYVGWLLICSAVLPSGEGRRPGSADSTWALPPQALFAAWIALAAGYLVSGLGKLGSPAWVDGTALAMILDGPVARETQLAAWVAEWPAPLLRALSWSVLALELGFAPLCFWGPSRAAAWCAMTLMHLAIPLLLDVESVSIVMLIFHLLVLEGRWFDSLRRL